MRRKLWMKVMVTIIALAGTFSAGYAYFNTNMQAASVSIDTSIQWLKPGNKFFLGRYNSSEIVWGGLTESGSRLWAMGNFDDQIYSGKWYNMAHGQAYTGDLRYGSSPIYVIPEKIQSINSALSNEEKTLIVQQNSNPHGESYVFTPTPNDVADGGTMGLTTDLRINSGANSSFQGYGWGTAETERLRDGSSVFRVVDGSGALSRWYGYNDVLLRPAVQIDRNDIVFAIEDTVTGNELEDITLQNVSPTDANDGGTNHILRIRQYNTSLSMVLNDITTGNDASVAEIAKGENLTLKADASIGEQQYVSALIFNEDGTQPLYYKTLELAKGNAEYTFDTLDLPVGTYVISLVNERKSTTDNALIQSSRISEGRKIKIVDELSNLTFSPTQNLIYNTNVSTGDTIGVISTQNGADSPIYKLISDPAYADEVDHFEIDSNGNVNVKGTALQAGTYHFKIQAQDGNGSPSIPIEITVTITVKKKETNVSFQNTDKIKIKIGDINGIEEFITTNNTEITTGGEYDPVYTLSEGISGTGLTIVKDPSEPKKFKIVIASTTSAMLPATFKLKVSLPNTTNYVASSSVEKEIYVYKNLSDLIWTPTKIGNYSIEDVSSGSVVGTLLARDGIPNYHYEFTSPEDSGYDEAKANDNDKFIIENAVLTSGVSARVKTNTSLGAGTYSIQMKVIDQMD